MLQTIELIPIDHILYDRKDQLNSTIKTFSANSFDFSAVDFDFNHLTRNRNRKKNFGNFLGRLIPGCLHAFDYRKQCGIIVVEKNYRVHQHMYIDKIKQQFEIIRSKKSLEDAQKLLYNFCWLYRKLTCLITTVQNFAGFVCI